MNGGSSAEREGHALLTTISPNDDPAEVFFDLCPTLEELYNVTNADALTKMKNRVEIVLATLRIVCHNGKDSKDPDFNYIFDSFIKGESQQSRNCMSVFEDSMASLALSKSRNGGWSSQGTKKDQLLTYYLWRLHGSKDEASPFPVSVPAASKVTGAFHGASHDFLPSSTTTRGPCSNCGHPQSTNWCSGCRIMKSGKVVFATFYCGRGCMKAHWQVHKPACNEVRALRRAATLFTELWLEYSQVTHPGYIESVTEKDGLIEMNLRQIDPPGALVQDVSRPFPRHLVASEEQALACMAVGTCEAVFDLGRTLFELVMRRKSPIVEYKACSCNVANSIFSCLCGCGGRPRSVQERAQDRSHFLSLQASYIPIHLSPLSLPNCSALRFEVRLRSHWRPERLARAPRSLGRVRKASGPLHSECKNGRRMEPRAVHGRA